MLSQYYPPEVGATQTRVHHVAQHLSAAGHDVAVIAEVPNHPGGLVLHGFGRRFCDRRHEEGLDVLRVWVAASPRKSFWRRIAFYLSYAVCATVAALVVLRRRPDVIFASSPPLPVLLVARVLSVVWRRPYVADIRDIWPAVGVALGELHGRQVVAAAERLERALYRHAAAITTVTDGFVRHVAEQGADPRVVYLVPNGTLPDVFTPDLVDPALRARLGLGDGLVVGYVGNHGIAQGLGAVLDAAQVLQSDTDVQFLFVGEGPVKAALRDRAARRGITNVVFHPQVPMAEVAPYINACDVMLVPLRALAVLDTFVPSKMFDYLACQKPVVVAARGEARRLLEASGGGYAVDPEDPAALAGLLRELAAGGDLAARGKQGREWVLAHYSRDHHVDGLVRVLQGVADGR